MGQSRRQNLNRMLRRIELLNRRLLSYVLYVRQAAGVFLLTSRLFGIASIKGRARISLLNNFDGHGISLQ